MGLSSTELIIIMIIVVLLFGAKKIPELAKGIGSGIKTFKEEMNSESDEKEQVTKNSEKATDTKITETKKEA